jgi:alkanesulfonate monooxygenase SsuD/methylene tetrahydromethanopterin reductase-like flavin-dependent oxidoreductase (luciferase family)
MSCGHHEAAWRLPESDPSASLDVSYWTNLARIAERGTFDSVFLADGPALWGHARFRPGGALEPTVLLTALAGATSRIGLIATASTSYNHPYNLARRFASLDHVSGGRAGWNIVTTATAAAAQNFGLDDNPGPRRALPPGCRVHRRVDPAVGQLGGRRGTGRQGGGRLRRRQPHP